MKAMIQRACNNPVGDEQRWRGRVVTALVFSGWAVHCGYVSSLGYDKGLMRLEL